MLFWGASWGSFYQPLHLMIAAIQAHVRPCSPARVTEAPMPTASTAQILGNNESFEPYTSPGSVPRTRAASAAASEARRGERGEGSDAPHGLA